MYQKTTSLILLFCICQLGIFAQNDFYYTFDSEKIKLEINPDQKVLHFSEVLPFQFPLPAQQLDEQNFLIDVNLDLSSFSGYQLIPTYRTDEGTDLYYTNEVVLKIKESTLSSKGSFEAEAFGLTLVKATPFYQLYTTDSDALQVSKTIYESGKVEFCTPNFIANVEQFDYYPNDAYFNQQWYLHNTGQGTNDGKSTTPNADIDAPQAWDISKGSPNVVVAIIDEGVTSNHPDLPNTRQLRLNGSNFAYFADGTNNPNDPSPTVSTSLGNNHGNACAGLVAATQDNNEGITGVAPLSRIMPIKIPFGNYPASIYADALLFGVVNGADILSNSWGYNTSNPNFQPIIVSAISYALSNQRLVVFAAGNTANRIAGNQGFVGFPANANLDNLITVSASDRNNRQANYSPNGTSLTVSAPSHTAYHSQIAGESFNIWTIDIPGTNYGYNTWRDAWSILPPIGEASPHWGPNAGAYTGRMGGTSAATPIVAGVLALMKSVNPFLTLTQYRIILENTSDKVGLYNYNWNPALAGHSLQLGHGKVNAYRAVERVQSITSPTLDLYVKDSPKEQGQEPNITTELMWTSDDIWVRNWPDRGLTHQNPDYNVLYHENYVKVRVINKSFAKSTGAETLKLYWAKAATDLSWPSHWDGSITRYNSTIQQDVPLGGEIGTLNIPALEPGEAVILTFPWVVPNPEHYQSLTPEPWHFCLLARIVSDTDPMTFEETHAINENVRNNNNIAWKNISIITIWPTANLSAAVAVGNSSDTERSYTLELFTDSEEEGIPIYEAAEIIAQLDTTLLKAWSNGGNKVDHLGKTSQKSKQVITGNHARFKEFRLSPNERGILSLSFHFLTQVVDEKQSYTYHVVQRDVETGELIGGETYVIEKDYNNYFLAKASVETNEAQGIIITGEDINQAAQYNWYNSEGELIHVGQELQVAENIAKIYQLEVISDVDGFKDYVQIDLDDHLNKIITITPNPAGEQIAVTYRLHDVKSAYLMVLNIQGENSRLSNYILNVENQQANIDVSTYQTGVYSIALVVDGVIRDAKSFVKE